MSYYSTHCKTDLESQGKVVETSSTHLEPIFTRRENPLLTSRTRSSAFDPARGTHTARLKTEKLHKQSKIFLTQAVSVPKERGFVSLRQASKSCAGCILYCSDLEETTKKYDMSLQSIARLEKELLSARSSLMDRPAPVADQVQSRKEEIDRLRALCQHKDKINDDIVGSISQFVENTEKLQKENDRLMQQLASLKQVLMIIVVYLSQQVSTD
jgi:hypothetical protein